ncbi:isoamyl acetate-hydrolyzing esterase [Coemansia sp. RSA 1813]|nr:isoamyl acetate-hydrolyzing esterase [Coemansia sp. RSA 1646]KAJ1768112.1 isoamyl acetate-hydrolyzing esterase [Coemansia sp. RSA 1843]KAJ2088031.1 isoamyl acetate-hydrolyzing esterase [Coemansia sp. RSA 986]KAJ2211951.1 isoamyl acetate-hydrolyzing esterase [Coemansia sp. RSA 487]KAJ2565869.1 isoamyl acetate-hydrolyzing esterase [Coemansia sp. RSA 1813]
MSIYKGHMYDTVVCFGDSLTQHGWDVTKHGWTAQIAQAYLRKLDIINRGFSGYNSRHGRILLPQILPQDAEQDPEKNNGSQIRLLTILFGSNDAQFAPYNAHVPLDEFRTNIEFMVRTIASASYLKSTRLVLITPPPLALELFARSQAKKGKSVDRSNKVTRQYADAVRDVAREHNVPCVDLWPVMESRPGDFLWDGLHLNARGNDLLFKLLMQTVCDNFPELDPESMPFIVPHHEKLYNIKGSIDQSLRLQ